MNQKTNSNKGGSAVLIIIVIFIMALAGVAGWYFFLKKSSEDGHCSTDSKCQTGLKCVNQICSSGKIGSVCTAKEDCQSGFCVNQKCTEGKIGNACATYKDCQTGLLCQKGSCVTKPDYSKYFDKVVISKMKPGLPPGPNNPLTVTNTFAAIDAVEVDFVGVKPATQGKVYLEIVNSVTGEVANSTQNKMDVNLAGQDTGFGTDLGGISPGEYDLNIYLNDKLVYSTQIILK